MVLLATAPKPSTRIIIVGWKEIQVLGALLTKKLMIVKGVRKEK